MNEPRITIRLNKQHECYEPGETLECEYRIEPSDTRRLQAVEESVLWYTEGKGDEDLAVHYFERRLPERSDLTEVRQFRTRLPRSPLSYHGAIVRVRWCVRVRMFLDRGKEIACDHPFELGHIPPARALSPSQTHEPEPSFD